MVSVSSGSITIDITGTAGLSVEGLTRVARSNEQPVVGGTRVGNGSLTITGLKDGVHYEVFAQVLDIAGCRSPASQILLATPREFGTSDLEGVQLDLNAEMAQVDNIGKIHRRRRHTVFWDDLYERHKADGRLNNWEIFRVGAAQDVDAVQNAAGSEPFFRDAHVVVVQGHMALFEETNSEKVFQRILDDIVLRFRLNNQLNGALIIPTEIQRPTIEHVMFGSVLCHFAEMILDAQIRVGG